MIEVSGIELRYGERVLVRDVSFHIGKGEFVLLCGPNGSGKSTLMRRIAAEFPRLCAMVPTRIPKVKGFTGRDFLRSSLFEEPHAGEEVIDKALEAMELESLGGRDISTLSDGEFQKLCIASALVRKRPVLLLDEPTAFLDAGNRIQVLDTLKQLCEGGLTILFSSHDLHEAAPRASRVFAIGPDGTFHTGGPETILKAFPDIVL